MSMILDAIKRSRESPEGGGSVPSLDTEHYVAPDGPIWKKAGVKFVSVSAVGAMVVVLALLYSSNRDGSDSSIIEAGGSYFAFSKKTITRVFEATIIKIFND